MTVRTVLSLAIVLLCVVASATVRIQTALNDPNFDREQVDGMLRSDPGLLTYFVQRLIDGGGVPPEDFAADTHVEHPNEVNLLEDFTIAQEFIVAWTWPLVEDDVPLHVWCVMLFGVFASLTAVGVWGLVRELTGSVAAGCSAAALWCLLPANYRTIGFILIREDFAMPWAAAAVWLFVRALRVQSHWAFAIAAVPTVLALASWHAMGFALCLPLMAAILWAVRSGETPFTRRGAWTWWLAVAGLSLAVPALRSKAFILSLPMQMVAALACVHVASVRWTWARGLGGRALSTGAGLLGAAGLHRLWTAWRGGDDYGHVIDLMVAKVTHAGALPDDPDALSFGARILWQGPFDTHHLDALARDLGLATWVALAGVALSLWTWWRGRGASALAITAAATVGVAAIAWLVQRNVVLAGVAAPVLAAVAVHRLLPGTKTTLALAVVGLLQLVPFSRWVDGHAISWYALPARQTEIARLVQWIRTHRDEVPADAAIASDYVNSTAVLAGTGNPILLQPKYETEEARRRAEEFLNTVLRGSADEVRAMLSRYDCRFLLIERGTLWSGSKFLAGFRQGAPVPTQGVIPELLSTQNARLTSIPGFRLVYRSPKHLRRTDLFRLYEVAPPD